MYKNSLIIIIIISEKKRERENIEATSKGKTPRSQTYANTRQEEKKQTKWEVCFYSTMSIWIYIRSKAKSNENKIVPNNQASIWWNTIVSWKEIIMKKITWSGWWWTQISKITRWHLICLRGKWKTRSKC